MTVAELLTQARAERQRLLDRLAEVEGEIAVFEGALSRAGESVPPESGTPVPGAVPRDLRAVEVSPEVREWRRLTLKSAVQRVLAEADGALTRTEVFERLREVGRPDELPTVSATLSYLKRTGDVLHLDNMWCRKVSPAS